VDTQLKGEERAKDTKEKVKNSTEEDLIKLIRKRYKYMSDADHDNRLDAMEDLKFVNEPGWQWDENMKQERGQRPCYEFNKLRITCKRIINDIRANRPSGKIRAVENGDKEQADIREGLVRNIWNTSDGDSAMDYAAEFQVACGMGAWRVDTVYSEDTGFEQDIKVKLIENPFCLYADPSCKDPLKRDADDWILTEKISFKEYETRYPKADRVDFEEIAEFDDDDEWQDEQSVRIAEYWYKEPAVKELWLMEDGKVVDSTTDEAKAMLQDPEIMETVKNKRMVNTHKIMTCIASGEKVLEGPTEWPGSKFPFVMVYGEHIVVDGDKMWWGIARFAKDAQRSYNVARTAISETIAMAPKAKFWATVDQASGLTDQWSESHKKNLPFNLYNADPKAPGPPQRMGGADVPQALIAESQIASQEIKEVTGIFDESLGAEGDSSSGRAVYARAQQGEIATFNYQDNIAKAIKLTYEIILDLIPHVYDTERELRILGSDDTEDYVRVNQVVFDPTTAKSMRVNDLAAGKYDVTVTVGPSFATRRQEATEMYSAITDKNPELMGIAGDLIMKSMDLPYAEDIAERMKVMLPPQIQQMIDQDKKVPPEVAEAMRRADAAMQEVQQYGQLVQQAADEVNQDKAKAEADKAEVQKEIANLKTAEAQFEAKVAKLLADLTLKEAGISTKTAQATMKMAGFSEKAANTEIDRASEVVDTTRALDDIMSQFMTAVDDVLGNLGEKSEELDKRTSRKVVGGATRREGGKLVADLQFDDGTASSVTAIRGQSGLEIVPNDPPGGAHP